VSEKRRYRALIYNRASHDPAGQAVSVESQDTENRAWCERQGWDIAGAITDNDRSATRFATKQREGFRQIWAGLDDHRWGRVDVLVTWASSRNQRRLDGYVDLRELCVRHGVRLAYKGRIYDLTVGADRFQTGLDALLDERDAEEIRDGILRSHRASVAAGRPRGSIPYGYTRTYLPGLRRVGDQVPDPVTAPVVQQIVADVLAGVALYRIAQRLNRDGVITPQEARDQRRGRRVERAGWSASMIRNLLAKPSLMGMRSHRGVVVGEGTWQPIVAPADWQAVQAVLNDPLRPRPDSREPKWLLSGIATCGVCGGWLRPMLNRGRMTYVCAGLTPSSAKGHVARDQEKLDVWVVARVVGRLLRPDALQVFAPRVSNGSPRGEIETELADARARLAAFEISAGSPGGVSAAAFARIEARLTTRIGELEQALAPPVQLPREVAEVAGPDAEQVWARLSLSGRRRVVRALCTITVDPVARRGRQGFEGESIRLVWRGQDTA
jgi:site-specific DNA recombinase